MIRAGIIGLGGIANAVHLPAIQHIESVEIVSVCDLVEERAIKACQKYGIAKYYTNYLTMLEQEELDCMFILVQPDQTFRIAYECLNHNLDILIEKPAGVTLFQTEALLQMAEKKQRIVQVGMNRRHIPLIQTVLSKFTQADEIHQVECTFFKHGDVSFYGGCESAFICDTIHSIDLLSYLAKSQPKNAVTVARAVNSRLENSWNSVIQFENGVTGIIKAGYQTGGRVHSVEIHGTYMSAYVNLGFGGEGCDAKLLYNNGSEFFSLSSAGVGDFTVETLDGKTIAGSDKYWKYYGYYAEDLDFIQSVISRNQPLSNIYESYRSMQLADFILAHRM